ncbi:MAG: HD domain-containing protein [Armatimonadetes bacterium]|nr:HD domain-containing protein [Armatimonadota bacterium]
MAKSAPSPEVAVGTAPDPVAPAVPSHPEAEEARLLSAARQLAESCGYEAGHTHQVTRLALALFDALRPLHRLGRKERLWLHCGALLHDIGWIDGQQAHHKTALRTILKTPALPFDSRQRFLVGAIARYHRKALPNAKKHAHFAALRPADRQCVRWLAALLRVADGLDRTHQDVVEEIACEVTPQRITLHCRVRLPADVEREVALAKGKLLEQVAGRELVVECERSRESVREEGEDAG